MLDFFNLYFPPLSLLLCLPLHYSAQNLNNHEQFGHQLHRGNMLNYGLWPFVSGTKLVISAELILGNHFTGIASSLHNSTSDTNNSGYTITI